MKVKINNVLSKEDEQVVIECVEMTPEFEDIRNYCLAKGAFLVGYTNISSQQQIRIEDILYIEAVGENVFAYTEKNVYEKQYLILWCFGGNLVQKGKDTRKKV